MKVFVLKQEDFDRLNAAIDRDPRWGQTGGSSVVLSEAEQKAHADAHRFFNYVVRTWIASVQS